MELQEVVRKIVGQETIVPLTKVLAQPLQVAGSLMALVPARDRQHNRQSGQSSCFSSSNPMLQN